MGFGRPIERTPYYGTKLPSSISLDRGLRALHSRLQDLVLSVKDGARMMTTRLKSAKNKPIESRILFQRISCAFSMGTQIRTYSSEPYSSHIDVPPIVKRNLTAYYSKRFRLRRMKTRLRIWLTVQWHSIRVMVSQKNRHFLPKVLKFLRNSRGFVFVDLEQHFGKGCCLIVAHPSTESRRVVVEDKGQERKYDNSTEEGHRSRPEV
jgi:hypothetical protein